MFAPQNCRSSRVAKAFYVCSEAFWRRHITIGTTMFCGLRGFRKQNLFPSSGQRSSHGAYLNRLTVRASSIYGLLGFFHHSVSPPPLTRGRKRIQLIMPKNPAILNVLHVSCWELYACCKYRSGHFGSGPSKWCRGGLKAARWDMEDRCL
jgi:hypothetical protein